MDNCLQLTDKDRKEQNLKERNPFNPHITRERIEKLKKTFQPFWMRGMILHQEENEQTSNATMVSNQI